MNRRAFLAVTIVAALGGCLQGNEPPVEAPGVFVHGLDAETDLSFVADVRLGDASPRIQLTSTGWGQLRIHNATSLSIRIEHESLSFSDWTEGPPYTLGNFTIIEVDAWPELSSEQWQYFSWIGRPAPFTSPMGSSREADEGTLTVELAPGQVALLTIATSVPGYSIVFGSGTGPTSTLTLGTWPVAHSFRPIGSEEGIAQEGVRAAFKENWRQDLVPMQASSIHALGWFHDTADTGGARLGVSREFMDIQVNGFSSSNTPPSDPYPMTGLGSQFAAAEYRQAIALPGDDVSVQFDYETTDVRTTEASAGLVVIELPLEVAT